MNHSSTVHEVRRAAVDNHMFSVAPMALTWQEGGSEEQTAFFGYDSDDHSLKTVAIFSGDGTVPVVYTWDFLNSPVGHALYGSETAMVMSAAWDMGCDCDCVPAN